MAFYLKGIGDGATRTNEILPTLDARINKFICGHESGIVKGEYNEFAAQAIDRGVIIKSGLMQAHGFFGYSDTEVQINFIMPASTNYVQIYAEVDLSVVPNKFEIKASSMSNSTAFTFRQDNLRAIINGKYQLPLWQVTLTASTIILTNKRSLINKPANAVHAEEADYALSADYATSAGTCTGNAASASRVNDQISANNAVEFYVGNKKVRIEV